MGNLGPTLDRTGIFPTLRDPDAQAHFTRDGIVVLPFLEPATTLRLRNAILELLPDDPGPFFDLFRNNPPELRKQLDEFIRSELEVRAAEVFVDHDFWSATVLVKPPGPGGEVGLHSDWNMVDESQYRSGLIWVALSDTDESNGGLYVVPGTNRLDVPYRGHNVHYEFDAPEIRALIDAHSVPVDVPAGHAAIWDNRLLHGSGPNDGTEWRIAAALGFKPREANLYHYRHTPDGTPQRYQIQRDFFMDYLPFDPEDHPTGPHVVAVEELQAQPWELSEGDLNELGPLEPIFGTPNAAAHPARRMLPRLGRVLRRSPKVLASRLRRRPISAGPTGGTIRRTFIDPDLQLAFDRDGYTVIDLLDADQVAELRAVYDELEHVHQVASPWVDGFETTLYDGRRDYRAAILEAGERIMSGPLSQVIDDYRIMFANFVVKLPHSAEVPPHADWTFLDEDRFRSATVWCPLVDTGTELANGPLGVAVGSQERIDFLRIANVPSYDRCVEAVTDLRRVVPTLRAGQAIVMDNRVVHFSPPNETDQTRVAIGCVVGPAEAELRHYWLDENGQLLRFTLDRSFYLSYQIGQPNGTEGITAIDVVPAHKVTGISR